MHRSLSETGECEAPPPQYSPPGIRGLVAVTTVVMAAVIVFATIFFTGRPDTKPFVGAFAAHLTCPLQGFFLSGKCVVAVRLFGSNAGSG